MGCECLGVMRNGDSMKFDSDLSSSDVQDILGVIDDGFLFEGLSQEFLTARLGYQFISSGGIKDRGIDGLEYACELVNRPTAIFQITIDKKPEIKLRDTLDKLRDNGIEVLRLTYVTSVRVKNKDLLMDQTESDYDVNLRIWDAQWFGDNTNNSEATKATFVNFANRHLRELQKPGGELAVNDFIADPRMYVFLMHQLGSNESLEDIDAKLIETLVLYALRDTDPDQNSFMSLHQIQSEVRSRFDFEIERLERKINKAIKRLTQKPNKKVNEHPNAQYCLPYETRLKIISDNARDKLLYNSFMAEAEKTLRAALKAEDVRVQNLVELLKKSIELIYYKQGLEFADFLLNAGSADQFENSLASTVDQVLDDAGIIDKNRNKVKAALIEAIREIVYSGSVDAKAYLKSLSKTYLMLFLLKCEPNVVDYFRSMAGKLRIFVCTSILVPAFSEVYLEDQNKRYWNLLKSARSRGVKLFVNDTIVDELLFHIRNSYRIFEEHYSGNLDKYGDGFEEFVDQILIRAFLYSKNEGKVNSYRQFIDNFITFGATESKQELIDFLDEEFGVEYLSDDSPEMNVNLNEEEFSELFRELKSVKGSAGKAQADARLILTIYALRSSRGETRSSLDGYKTWWLSSDTSTHRAVSTLFGSKYPVSCYMRPDFLYNYVSFTPPKENIAGVYADTFPNLLGVQISNHIPPNIAAEVRNLIGEHKQKSDGRVKAKVRQLADKLKSGNDLDYTEKLESFFSQA